VSLFVRQFRGLQGHWAARQKRKLALAASALFQLAEQLESGTALTTTHVGAYREMLADAIDDELRKAIDTLLSDPVTS
jgi:hypothetical protein